MKQSLLFCGALILTISGCGGGGSNSNEGASGGNAPSISSVSPADGAVGVSRTVAVTAKFSTDIITDSVSDASFSLIGGDAVDGTVSFDAFTNTANFTPAQELALLTSYTATLGADIAALSGTTLGAEYSWAFTTADGTLSATSDLVQSDSQKILMKPRIAYLNNGSAIAVWQDQTKSYPFSYQAWVKHYIPGSGWGTPELLDATTSSADMHLNLVADSDGNAFVIWRQSQASVWANYFDSTSGEWGGAEQISASDQNVGIPSVSFNNDGNAVAVWNQRLPEGTLDIFANIYTKGEGWGTAAPIESIAGDARYAEVGFDGSGNAIAVWAQDDGTQFSIYGNRLVDGEGWGDATLLESIDTAPADIISTPKLGVDDNGNALVVWDQNDGTVNNLWYNRYDASSGWQGETLLESHDTTVRLVAFDMNRAGTALVLWSQDDTDTGTGKVASKRYLPGVGWGAEETFDFTDFLAYDSDLVVDDAGNGLFFQAYDDNESSDLWFNRYSATSGWASATFLTHSSDGYGEYNPHLSVRGDGEAMVIFSADSSDGSQQIWSRSFK
jgi:hypothetical protein